jgi:sensor histidine kinase YesM
MRSALQSTLQIYKFCFPVWTVVGLFFFTQGVTQKLASHDLTPWWHYLISWLIGVYLCALLTPLIFWLSHRFPIERRNWLRRAGLHLLFSALFSLVEIAVHGTLIHFLGLFPTLMKGFAGTIIVLLLIAFHQNIMTYWTVLGIAYALRYYGHYQERKQQALRLELQASELKTQLVQAQLSALNTQLQPHFLFNTLNAIMVLVRQRKANEAEEMLARLSDLLRCVLEDVDAQEVPLRRELEYVQLYLSIQQVRFQDRLRVEIHADSSLLDAAVPHLGLQPLVENAIQHGIGQSSSAGKLHISAARLGDTLEMKVYDDGPGLPPAGWQSGRGIGLANTQARLRQLYGNEALLTVESSEPCGTVATVTLPYHLILDDANAEMMELHALNSAGR